MHDPAATLDLDGKKTQLSKENAGRVDQAEINKHKDSKQANNRERPVVMAGRRGMKFSYPSGSKPLDGYTIKRGIGIGGFGEVYFALSDAGKEVALKKIQRNLDSTLR